MIKQWTKLRNVKENEDINKIKYKFSIEYSSFIVSIIFPPDFLFLSSKSKTVSVQHEKDFYLTFFFFWWQLVNKECLLECVSDAGRINGCKVLQKREAAKVVKEFKDMVGRGDRF